MIAVPSTCTIYICQLVSLPSLTRLYSSLAGKCCVLEVLQANKSGLNVSKMSRNLSINRACTETFRNNSRATPQWRIFSSRPSLYWWWMNKRATKLLLLTRQMLTFDDARKKDLKNASNKSMKLLELGCSSSSRSGKNYFTYELRWLRPELRAWLCVHAFKRVWNKRQAASLAYVALKCPNTSDSPFAVFVQKVD